MPGKISFCGEMGQLAYAAKNRFADNFSPGTADNPYGFTGESRFPEADNLIFLCARYYAPALGRFLSRDPISGTCPASGHCRLAAALPESG